MTSLMAFQSWTLKHLENSLSPLPSHSDQYRLPHHLGAVLYAPLSLIAIAGRCAETIMTYATSFFAAEGSHPKEDFNAVVQDSRKWALLKDTDITFDPPFAFGVTTCTWQDSAIKDLKDSQWTDWEKKCVPASQRSKTRSNLFQLYKTKEGRALLIDRLRQLGVTQYRFSTEMFHQDQLSVYVDWCKALRDAGIAPEVTTHHFSEDKAFHAKGSFEKEENIADFKHYLEAIIPSLTQPYKGKPLVGRIYPINEPNIEALSRYVLGLFSPGYMMRFGKAGEFLHNLLKAQCVAYATIKEINPDVEVGMVHQYLKMVPTNPLIGLVTHYFNKVLNDTLLHFYKTGIFEYKIPFVCHIYDDTLQQAPFDCIGLQYYARVVAGMTGSTSYHEPMTLMPYREDPEGVYEAITEIYAACQKPVRISENGISTLDETQRERYLQRSLYAVWRAREKIGKENCLSFNYWCPFPTSEWHMGPSQHFSAYDLEASGQIAATPKRGMTPFIRTAKACRG